MSLHLKFRQRRLTSSSLHNITIENTFTFRYGSYANRKRRLLSPLIIEISPPLITKIIVPQPYSFNT